MTKHSAPPVVYPIGRSPFQFWFLLGLWFSGLGLLTVWFAGTARLDWRIASGCAAVLAAGLSLYITWRDAPCGQVGWDGAVWRWESAKAGTESNEQSLAVVADFQKRLVLVIESDSGARLWFCAERIAFPERWMDFRRAVYSPRGTSAIPPGRELSSEHVAAVAVSSHAQSQHSIRIES